MKTRKNLTVWLAMSIFLLVMACATAAGRTIYVDDDGPADFNTIQAAIDESNDGDTIIVAEGTYENVSIDGKSITLRSTDPTNPDVVAATIIDGGRREPAVYFSGAGDYPCWTLSGFTITNAGGGDGTGVRCFRSKPTIINNVISDNTADTDGGGILCSFCPDGMIFNNLINRNLADDGAGGGILLSYNSSLTIANCTITDNVGCDGAHGIFLTHSSSAVITNSIVWGNNSGQIACSYSNAEVRYSNIKGGYEGIGNIDADPCFADAPNGDYHLLPSSPCIDAGDNTVVTVCTDLDGNARIVNGTVDMGAYEFPGPRETREFYVDDDAPNDPVPGDPDVSDPLEDGTQAHPFDAIQKAIDAALCGDTVIVIDGTYFENINFKGKNIILRSTHPNNPDIVAATIIDGNNIDSVVTFTGTENETCVLSGFTIQNGFHDYEYTRGGGGICGGSEFGDHTRATIQNNIITRNFAWDGGGLSCCDGFIEKNTITGNTARIYDGGGGLFQCNGIIRSNIIAGNRSGGCESAGALSYCDGTIENNTITQNHSQGYGAVAYCRGTIRNCIIWANSPNRIPWWSTPSYSDIQGWGGGGDGNIDADPCFIHPGYWEDPCNTPYAPWDDMWIDGDYHLLPDSSCIDAGDPNYVAEPNETDLDGRPRIIGGRIDMGAYEYSPPIPAEVRVVPRSINPASMGKWITCYIWLPEDYNVADIEVDSVLLEYEIQAQSLSVDEGQQVAVAKFSRSEVQSALGGLEPGDVELTVSGELSNGMRFEGTDTIRVIDKSKKK